MSNFNGKVTKRNGKIEQFDVSKIRNVINWASVGLKVDPMKLESKLDIILKPNISTIDIQRNLIANAAILASVDEPDWKYVAGRLYIMSLWKNLGRDPKNKANNYVDHVFELVADRLYSDEIMSIYSEEELQKIGEFIEPNRDLLFDYAGAVKLKKSHLCENESPQEAFATIAALLASVENKEDRLYWAKKFYDAISLLKVSLATPFLANLRRPEGNLSSCFVLTIDDSLDSITKAWDTLARISKNGGGAGVNISKIRAEGSWIKGYSEASGGVTPLVKVINDIAIYINQLGKRAGAFTVALDIWHLDLPDFLELQTENGDLRKKAYDIQPQVVVPDLFMQRLKNAEDWTLFDPYEVKEVLGFDLAELWGDNFNTAYMACEQAAKDGRILLTKTINTRVIIKSIIRNYLETGLPYIAFKDTINYMNPNKHDGYIPSVNLCVESYSNTKADELIHTCNLISLNLANIEDEELEEMMRLSVRMLDNAICMSEQPVQESTAHNIRYRTIGVGAMGLADWLAKHDLSYTTKGTIEAVDNLFEKIALAGVKESIELSKERGPFEAFVGSMWDTGERIDLYKSRSKNPTEWNKAQSDIFKYGIRNSQITAIAPNTSTSLIQGCTASILPAYNKFYYDNNSSGVVPISPKYIDDKFFHYNLYKNVDSFKMTEIVSTIQHWIDTGISYEPMFDLNNEKIDAFYIYNFIIDAWEKGIKAIYYIRGVQQDITKEECESCAG